MNRVAAIVPARAGSKGVRGKNVRQLGRHPLLAWSVVAALATPSIDRVIVSTDSEEIAEIAVRYGAEVPFLRPAELAGDASTDLEFLVHALDNLAPEPELLVLLRPTTPLREPSRVAEAVEALRARADATSVRSVHELPEPPQKMLGIEDGLLVGLFPDDPRPEYFNLPRQAFAPAYHPNGYVDVLRAEVVRAGAVYGSRMLALVTPVSVEVDRPEDFAYLEYLVGSRRQPILELLRTG